MLQYIFNILSAPEYLNTVYTRSFIAFFISLIVSLCWGERLINFLRLHQKKGQPIRECGPQSHLETKKGTPTMGGILILISTILSILLCADLSNAFIWTILLVLTVYGFVGFADDYTKVTKQTSNAMSAKMKLFLQFLTSIIAITIISYQTPSDSRFLLTIPYFKDLSINLCWFYIPFAMIVITGASNAVNLSDGLDGLASGLMILVLPVFLVIAYICGSELFSDFYILPIPNAAEVSITCAAVIGSCLGFLWFNSSPAKVFMGDTGSLALGAYLGTISIILKHEILLAIVGSIFVIEALSVMLQVFWFKRTGGKRLFKMAPIHHHFEQCGWPETRVVNRFWIVGFILMIIGFLAIIHK
ncbi:MAG: phospho-N-acetylmuramoyl-pentapeptide-transferase [Alphaproteobacteria bacterium]|nr:phospho-N-acetylmuramoyl-pentapeptide-transferase [Alphaproteobacteria bacterium]